VSAYRYGFATSLKRWRSHLINLYQDQIDLLDRTRAALRSSKSVLMQAATGSGKTVISAAMLAGALERGRTCLFNVPRRELLQQTSNTLDEFGIPHSFISSGREYNPHSRIHISTTETLARRLDTAPSKDLVITDECHFGSNSLGAIIGHYKAQGSFNVGLSATPTKLSGRGLGCWFDDMVCGESVSWLIENGRLSRYRLFAPDTPDLSMIKTVAGEYAKGQLSDRMEDDRVLIGHAVDHYKRLASGRINMTFCVSRKHSEITNEQFRAAGIPSACVDGETPDIERRHIFRALARRELLNVCNVELCTFGFDLSAAAGEDVTIESLSILRPTQSLALYSQIIGRALRRKPEAAIICDHAGNTRIHGLPDAERKWTLADDPRISRKGSERALPVRQCPQCDMVHRPAPSCPECGYVYPVQYRDIDEVDGELAEVTAAEIKAAAERKEQIKRERAACKTIDELRAFGVAQGYKNPSAWAAKWYSLRSARR